MASTTEVVEHGDIWNRKRWVELLLRMAGVVELHKSRDIVFEHHETHLGYCSLT